MKNDLKRQVERGEVSLRSAAYRLMRAGKCTFLPNDREVIRLLHIVIQIMSDRQWLILGWALMIIGAILLIVGVIGMVHHFSGSPSLVYQFLSNRF